MRIKTPHVRINNAKISLLHMGKSGLRDVCSGVERYKLILIPQGHPLCDAHVSRVYAEINE